MNTARHILVIDDEPVIARAVERICVAEGWTVTVALNASDALGHLDGKGPDLVLCDIMMSGLDGFQFLEALDRKGLQTPVIMMTGYSTVENAVRSLNTGNAIDFIPKPFTADELLSVVRRGLRYSKLIELESGTVSASLRPVNDSICPANYYQLGYMSWVFLEEEGTAKIGINDRLIRVIEGIEQLELHLLDEDLVQGTACAVATACDGSVHQIMCPMDGKILEINEEAQTNPSLVEKDPYFKGWLYRILPTDPVSNMKWLNLGVTKETSAL